MAFAPFSTTYTPEPIRCSGGETPGARALQDWACDESPWGEHLWDVGIYNCRYIAGTTTLSQHASGRAGDSAHNIVNGHSHPAGAEFALWLVANHAVLGVQEVISDGRRWTLATGWRAYGGISPHVDHVHWALNTSGGRYLTRARILSVAPQPPATDPQEDDDMPKQMLVYIGKYTRNVCQVSAARDAVHWVRGAEAIRGAKLMLQGDSQDPKAGAVCRLDPTATDPAMADLALFVLGLPFYGPMPPGHANLRAAHGITGPNYPGATAA